MMDEHKQLLAKLFTDKASLRTWLEAQPPDRLFEVDSPVEEWLDEAAPGYWHSILGKLLSFGPLDSAGYTDMALPDWTKLVDKIFLAHDTITAAELLAAWEAA